MNLLNRRFTHLSVVGLALVAIASCGARIDATVGYALRDRISQLPGLAWVNPVIPIADVGQSRRTTVYLAGRVDRHLPLVGQGLYELVDDSGAIWVLSPSAPPPVGTMLAVRATIQYEQILLRGQDVGEHYAEELERLPQEG